MDVSKANGYVDKDGIYIFVDKNTRQTKKNRTRHIKDGAPKKERGKVQITKEGIKINEGGASDAVGSQN